MLTKSITDNKGVVANVWYAVLGSFDGRVNPPIISITARGYVDSTHHDADLTTFVSELEWNIPADPTVPLPLPNGTLMQNVQDHIEQIIMAQAEFAGATQS